MRTYLFGGGGHGLNYSEFAVVIEWNPIFIIILRPGDVVVSIILDQWRKNRVGWFGGRDHSQPVEIQTNQNIYASPSLTVDLSSFNVQRSTFNA
jgi:hypothetical protein